MHYAPEPEERPEDYLSVGERVFLTTEAAEQEAKAVLWDEGYEAGGRDEWAVDGPTPNPYRMEDDLTAHRKHLPAPGEPAITINMDDDRITFRDQAALDEYVLGYLSEHVAKPEVALAVAKGVRDERRHRWESPHEGHCIIDARAALAAVLATLGGESNE